MFLVSKHQKAVLVCLDAAEDVGQLFAKVIFVVKFGSQTNFSFIEGLLIRWQERCL